MARQRKRIRAGELVVETLYSVVDSRQPAAHRAARTRASSMAQQLLNHKNSLLRLKLLLAANFDLHDLWVTLTFSDEYLPPTREAVRRRVKRFFADLRRVRALRGGGVRYIYSIEGGSGRWHVHMVLSSTGADDLRQIVAWWPWGSADVERIGKRHAEHGHPDLDTLAGYLAKEGRASGGVGRQAWTPSKGLRQPVVESRRVPDSADVDAPPPGAVGVVASRTEGAWGTFIFLQYWAPPAPTPPRPRE